MSGVVGRTINNHFFNSNIIYLLLAGIWVGCDPSTDELRVEGQFFKVQIVEAICDVAVMEILDEEFRYLGQPEWQQEEKLYHYVFFARLDCEDLEYLSKWYRPNLIGLNIHVALAQKNQTGNCDICDATIHNPPSVQYFIDIRNN